MYFQHARWSRWMGKAATAKQTYLGTQTLRQPRHPTPSPNAKLVPVFNVSYTHISSQKILRSHLASLVCSMSRWSNNIETGDEHCELCLGSWRLNEIKILKRNKKDNDMLMEIDTYQDEMLRGDCGMHRWTVGDGRSYRSILDRFECRFSRDKRHGVILGSTQRQLSIKTTLLFLGSLNPNPNMNLLEFFGRQGGWELASQRPNYCTTEVICKYLSMDLMYLAIFNQVGLIQSPKHIPTISEMVRGVGQDRVRCRWWE